MPIRTFPADTLPPIPDRNAFSLALIGATEFRTRLKLAFIEARDPRTEAALTAAEADLTTIEHVLTERAALIAEDDAADVEPAPRRAVPPLALLNRLANPVLPEDVRLATAEG